MKQRRRRGEFLDLIQDVALEAWLMFLANPECFATGSARAWGAIAAYHRRLDQERADRRQVFYYEALQRELLACNFDAPTFDQIIEMEERQRALAKAFQLLEPDPLWALIETFMRDGTHREAAAELGKSERTIKRLVNKGKKDLAVLLPDWNPHASSRGRDAHTNNSRSRPRAHSAPVPPDITVQTPERGDNDQPR
jgi:RNA polymerase sigma factor (sigma-70 family)